MFYIFNFYYKIVDFFNGFKVMIYKEFILKNIDMNMNIYNECLFLDDVVFIIN